jgi:hypothetical protein
MAVGKHEMPRGRVGQLVLAGGAVLVAVTLVWGLVRVWPSADGGTAALPQPASATSVPSPSPSALPSASPSPSPSAAPSPTPAEPEPPSAAPARERPRPEPSRAPVTIPEPPPPAAEPLPDDVDCPYYDGENASQSQVTTALDAAAAQPFWTVSQVSLPPQLIKAVAEQESGWQSAIIACDGGIGTMQVMPSTAEWMNQRFGTSHDVGTLTGNTMLGSAFLQWLVKYFGDVYFEGDYMIDNTDCQQVPEVPDHREWCLLNAVISAYNFGHGAVDSEATDGDETYYPNHQYIENVRALMARY